MSGEDEDEDERLGTGGSPWWTPSPRPYVERLAGPVCSLLAHRAMLGLLAISPLMPSREAPGFLEIPVEIVVEAESRHSRRPTRRH